MGVDSCRNHLIPPPPLRRHPVDIDPDDRHGGIGDEHRVRLWRDPHGILKTLPVVALCRHMATTYVLPFSSFLIPGREGIIQILYRGANKGLHVLLSRTQAGPGRAVKQEQEENSCNHVRTFKSDPVQLKLPSNKTGMI